MKYEKLFEPCCIGSIKLKNRVTMAPMVTRYTSPDGLVTDRLVDYYVERAKGGAGLIVLEACYSSPGGHPGRIGLYDDIFLPGLKRLVKSVHSEGAHIAIDNSYTN